MTYDLKIRAATVVDGTGAPPRTADIGVTDGVIVDVGRLTGPAHRDINADGALATPGFIDPHTHYDGQAFWDPVLEPSSRHGVTTAIFGNCGVGFAPVTSTGVADVINLMAGVEDIPADVLREGLKWDWRGFPEYLDKLARVPRTIDLGAQVPHDCIRLAAMGPQAGARAEATPDEIETMCRLTREALLAGAFGFSFGRVEGHKTADGQQTPSWRANTAELVAIAGVLRDLPYRVLQGVTDFRFRQGLHNVPPEFEMFEHMLIAAGRPMSLNLHQRNEPEMQGMWRDILAHTDRWAARGHSLRLQCNARATGSFFGLTASLNPFTTFPSGREIARQPLSERVAIMRDPAFRKRLLGETPATAAGDSPSFAGLCKMMQNLDPHAAGLFPLEDFPDPEPPPERSVAARARRRNVGTMEAFYDICLENEGQALIFQPRFNFIGGTLDNLHTMLSHPQSFFGVADAGAHLGYVFDAAATTTALAFWSRDRKAGPQLPLERTVRMMSGAVADHLGLTDRGTIAVGERADLNVIDFANLRLDRPRVVHDLPAGGRRFLQDSYGYLATFVKGTAIAENDVLTGARPGALIRAA